MKKISVKKAATRIKIKQKTTMKKAIHKELHKIKAAAVRKKEKVVKVDVAKLKKIDEKAEILKEAKQIVAE
jgi:hypothetical protein